MAWDDPVVWILIIAVVIFLFGANKIPGLAKSIGEARREFEKGWRGEAPGAISGSTTTFATASPANSQPANQDPLVSAAQREGIDTQGKTREQIASELAFKLNKK